MQRIAVKTIASIMREIRKDVEISPFGTSISEEATALPVQKFVNPDKWGVSPIESWSKSQKKNVAIGNIWDEVIYYMDRRENIDVKFCYFMDGIQRTTPIGKIRLMKRTLESVPIHFAQIGVVLLKRDNGKLTCEEEEIELLMEFPNDFFISESNIDKQKRDILGKVRECSSQAIQCVDTSYRVARLTKDEDPSKSKEIDGIKYPRLPDDELWNWCSDPAQFRNQARRWTTRYRDLREQRLYDKSLKRFGESVNVGSQYHLVLKDGPLTHTRGEFVKAALGIIKTFGTIFLSRPQMTKVLNLACGYRSPVFTKSRPEGDLEETDIYESESEEKKNKLISWYLRIRPVESHEVTWGLLRIEMHMDILPCKGHVARWSELDTQIIDEISRKISEEASPSSHPDPRWHNLIYPIKCCESYLRSRIVPNTTARYLLGGS